MTKTVVKAMTAKEALDQFVADKPKAKLRSMKRIIQEIGEIPTNFIEYAESDTERENGTVNFELLGQMAIIGVGQIAPDLPADDIEDAIDLDNIYDVMQAVQAFMTMTVPDGVIPPEMTEETGDEADSEGDEKNVA